MTWSRVMAVTDTDGIVPAHGDFHIELLFDSTNNIYFAAVSKRGLFVSTDQGAHWSQVIGSGLPKVEDMLRIALATRNGVLWALLLEPGVGRDDPPFFQLFESRNNARAWKPIPVPPGIASKGNLMYLAAPPIFTSLLFAAEFLFRTDNLGSKSCCGSTSPIVFMAISMQLPSPVPTNWYVGNDGGAWATTNRGDAWTSLNDNLRTLEMFSADAASGASAAMAGGAQDNGPMETVGGTEWRQLFMDDGMFAAADPQTPGAFFVEPQFGDIRYTRDATGPDCRSPVASLECAASSHPMKCLPSDSRLFSSGNRLRI